MATHPSAEKRARQSVKRKLVHSKLKGLIRSQEKNLHALIAKKDKENSKKTLLSLVSSLDRANTKKLFHMNKLARKKSRLHRLLKTIL